MRASHLEDYYQLLRFPSVSTDEAYRENVAECAHARRVSEQAHDTIDVEGQPNTNAPAHSLHTGTQLESRQQRRACERWISP